MYFIICFILITLLIIVVVSSNCSKNEKFQKFNKITDIDLQSSSICKLSIDTNSKKYSALEHVLKYETLIPGMWLEFGVASGGSINIMAKYTQQQIYGFDSFDGLPEHWIGTKFSRGSFNQNGNLPKVEQNVVLVKGLFQHTVKSFLQKSEKNVSFIHFDADLYSSTITVLKLLNNYIVPGTIMVFDEMYKYDTYKEGEFKAVNEFLEKFNRKCKIICNGGQKTMTELAIKIIK